MKLYYKSIYCFALILALIGCSEAEEDVITTDADTSVLIQGFNGTYTNSNFYTPPSSATKVTFTGTTSGDLNTLINQKSSPTGNGVIIQIPKNDYNWSNINLKTNVHLEIARGTKIKLAGTTAGIFTIGGSKNGARIKNVSIYGISGRFTLDITDSALANKNIYAVRIGRVDNFRIANMNIKDRRTSLNSILLVHVAGAAENRPGCSDGIIQNVAQTGAHTGYGLVQTYNANNVLFKNIRCDGGVTLRMETDDKGMKNELKNGSKTGGVSNIFANGVHNTNGLTAVMFSPHFVENGNVTINNVTAKGSAFAVRIEKGFLELFDKDKTYPITNAGRTAFKQFIEDQFSISGTALSGNPYQRANGTQWATRLSAAASTAPRNAYVDDQLGAGLQAGNFGIAKVNNVTATYQNDKGAKIKQGHLKFIPCTIWNNGLRNPGTSLGMFNGFEYHGSSVSLSVDNTTGTTGGSYNVTLGGTQNFDGFPSGFTQNIQSNTGSACNNNPSTITNYTASF